MALPTPLFDLALNRLQTLFPRVFKRIIERMNARDAVRGCAFPSVLDSLCRYATAGRARLKRTRHVYHLVNSAPSRAEKWSNRPTFPTPFQARPRKTAAS